MFGKDAKPGVWDDVANIAAVLAVVKKYQAEKKAKKK